MVNLPDITDLLEARKNYKSLYEALHKKVDEARGEISRCEEEIVRCYKAANISEEKCDHPVTRYRGMGESECACCNKIYY